MNKKDIYGKQKKKKKNSASPAIRPVKYQSGGVTSWDPSSFISGNLGAIQGLAGLGAGLVQEFSDEQRPNYGANIGSGILTGAASGAALGPLGAIGGAIIGGVTGLIGSSKREKQIQEAREREAKRLEKQYSIDSTVSLSPGLDEQFQTTGYFPYFENGGPVKGNRMYTPSKDGGYYTPNPAYTRGWRARIDGDVEVPITEKEFQKNRLKDNYITRYYDVDDNLPYEVEDSFFMAPETLLQQKVGYYTPNALNSDRELAMGGERRYENGGGIKKAYNPNLASKDKDFQSWYKSNTLEGKEGIPYSDTLSYDYYSFYRNGDYKDPSFNIENHFPDTYKRPAHPTFSTESIYSTPENPGGSWNGEQFIPDQGLRRTKYEKGGIVEDLYPFMDSINIEKGEALVNFNKGRGEILYKYYDDGKKFNGINPITGTEFKPHKKRGKDPEANFIPIPKAGEFVISKDYAKDYSDAYDRNDKIAIGTIKQNIMNDNILAAKEDKKTDKMKYGGAVPKKQLGGGPLIPYVPQINFGLLSPNPRVPSTLPGSGNINPSDIGLDIESQYSPAYIRPQESIVAPERASNNVLGDIARIAPSLFNIGRGLSGYEEEPGFSRPATRYTSAAEANLPERLNYNRLFDRVFANRNAAQRQIMDTASSPSVRRANLQQLYSNTNEALGDAFFQGEGINRQIDTQRSNFYAGQATQSLENQYRTDAVNRQIRAYNQANKAAASDLIGAGLSGLSQYSQVRSQERGQRNADIMRIQAINDILGNYSVSPAVRDYIMTSGMTPEELAERIDSGLYNFNR